MNECAALHPDTDDSEQVSIDQNIRRNPVYCSWNTNNPPPPYFDYCLFRGVFRAPRRG